jgi:hypothetical protein
MYSKLSQLTTTELYTGQSVLRVNSVDNKLYENYVTEKKLVTRKPGEEGLGRQVLLGHITTVPGTFSHVT